MSNLQYTIRNIPADIDAALRQRAKKSKQSFNATVINALRSSTQQSNKVIKNNIDWFYGSGGITPAEQKTFEDQRLIDKSAWDK